MKLAIHIFGAAGSHIPGVDHTEHLRRPRDLCSSFVATAEQVAPHSQLRSSSSALRIVGILAFGQSLIFLVIWLLVCASAGAAVTPPAGFTTELKASTYEPVKARDPFAKPGFMGQTTKVAPGVTIAFQLQGILYESKSPSAIVNGKLVTLDKIVTLSDGNGEVQVRATKITRDSVVLEAGEQKVELRLNPQPSPAPAKE